MKFDQYPEFLQLKYNMKIRDKKYFSQVMREYQSRKNKDSFSQLSKQDFIFLEDSKTKKTFQLEEGKDLIPTKKKTFGRNLILR